MCHIYVHNCIATVYVALSINNRSIITGTLKTLSSSVILSYIFYLCMVILVLANLCGGFLFLEQGLFSMLSGAFHEI